MLPDVPPDGLLLSTLALSAQHEYHVSTRQQGTKAASHYSHDLQHVRHDVAVKFRLTRMRWWSLYIQNTTAMAM